jgi:hypothetical protein
MKYTFYLNKFTLSGGFPQSEVNYRYDIATLESEAESVENAYEEIVDKVPEGYRIWCWRTDEKVPDEV